MVNLVKVRKKAKEKKSGSENEVAVAQSSQGAAPVVEPPQAGTASASAEAPVAAAPLVALADGGAGDEPPPVSSAPAARGSEKLEEFKRTANVRESDVIAADAEAGRGTSESVLELLLFTIAGEQYALAIERIVEIIPPRKATRVPNADETIVGIISLRGTIVSILDIRRRLGHPPLQTTGPDSRIIVVEHNGETAGFLVDRVSRVVRIDPEKIESHPVVSTNEQSVFIRGVFHHAQKLSIFLDLETLLRYQEHVDAWS